MSPMTRILACFAVLTAALGAPVLAQDKPPLTIGLSQFPPGLHSQMMSMMAARYVEGFTLRPLTVFNADWEVECLACTEVPTADAGTLVYEDGPDGKHLALTFEIVDGLAWGDGTPVTSADVAFAWEVGANPATGAVNHEFFKDIVEVRQHSPRRFTLVFDDAYCSEGMTAGPTALPAHLERPLYEEDPATYRNRTLYTTAPATPGLYNGPYVVSEWKAASYAVLTPNTHWPGPQAPFSRITLRGIENSTALVTSLRAGDIDYIPGEMPVGIDEVIAFEEDYGEDFTLLSRPGMVYEHIDLNLDSPLLQDRRVRRALLLGVNRQAVSERLFAGRQPVAHGNIHPDDTIYNPDLAQVAYDPEAAQTLLEEAGWTAGPDGVRVNAAGDRLSLTLITTSGNQTRSLIAQYLQSQWRKIGVELTVDLLPPRVMFGDRMNKRQFDHLAMYAWLSSPRNLPKTTLHSTMIPSEDNAWSGQNYPGYASAEMDQLIDDLETTCAAGPRQALFNRLQDLYVEDLPVLPLYLRADSHMMVPELTGVRATGHQFPASYWVTDWRLDR